jgi:hypothetical protein
MPFLKHILLLIALTCVLIVNSIAQIRETGIIVAVKDQLGDMIPDAQIFLNKSDKENKQIKTNSLGIGQFLKLSPGEYRITVSAAGFKEYESRNVVVKNNETQKIEIILEIASVESNVEIGEDDNITNAERPGVTTTLNEKEIANLPDNQEELERAIRSIGESVTGEELPISVNGVQGGKIPPKQAIQQIRINQNVFSAQYDGPFGGGIEIFTRSNVDKFKGYVTFSFADSRFNAADPFLGRRVPYQLRNYFFNLSGPLFGKKANFFIYGSHSESDLSTVVNAVVLDSNLQPVEFRESFAAPSRSETINLTINADPSKKHKLYFSYNFGTSRSKGQNVSGFSLPSRANDNNSQNHYLQLSDTYLLNANIVNQTRVLATYFSNNSFGGSDEAAINVLDAFFGGGSQQNGSNKNFRFDATNETTWQMGKYALGFGVRLRGERVNQNSTANFGGTYTFSGRLAPVLDANNNPVTNSAGTVLTTQISSLESYRRTLLFQQTGFSNQRIRELGGGANQFSISGGNPEIKVSQSDLGFYVQNSYKISETIAASFGVRYENQTNIDSNSNFAPRFGIIWAPKAKEKQNPLYALPRISIGYGMFYNRFGLNNILSVRQASNSDSSQYLITEANILDFYPNVPSANSLEQFALPRTQRFIDAAFETPYQSLLNITASKKMPKGYTLNFTFSHGTTFRQSFTQNVNAPLAGTFNLLNPSLAVRPLGNVGNVYKTQSDRKTKTDRISINLGFPNSEKLFASLRYSFIKSKGNVVSGSGSPFDPYDFTQEFAPTLFDGVQSVGGYFFYSLPYKISVGGDFSVSSGTKFNIFTGRDTNGDGFFSERPSFATDLSKPNLVETPYGILDPNPSSTDKLIPRNLGRGSKNIVFNSSLSKSFGFGEDKKNKKPPRQTINFNLRVNNVFNIINKGNPIGNMSSPNFLRQLSGFSDGGIFTINGAQQVNFPGRSVSFSIGFGF